MGSGRGGRGQRASGAKRCLRGWPLALVSWLPWLHSVSREALAPLVLNRALLIAEHQVGATGQFGRAPATPWARAARSVQLQRGRLRARARGGGSGSGSAVEAGRARHASQGSRCAFDARRGVEMGRDGMGRGARGGGRGMGDGGAMEGAAAEAAQRQMVGSSATLVVIPCLTKRRARPACLLARRRVWMHQ